MAISGRIGLVGGGNIGSALLKGILNAGLAEPGQITVAEMDKEKADELCRTTGVSTCAQPSELKDLDLMILAVKPADIPSCAAAAKAALQSDSLVITLAAGVRMATVADQLPSGQPLVRAMPNTPALIGMAATALTAGGQVTPEQKKLAEDVFAAVGRVVWVKEALMDAVTGLSGSGPAYVYLFIEALTDAGVQQGLDRASAGILAAQTVAGAAQMVLERSDQHVAQLKDMVTSPGGTTINGLMTLEIGGLRGLIMEAVAQASEKSRELGV
jgi:pyrroline-5-carboxylate reductase